jgi:hypothetical protein
MNYHDLPLTEAEICRLILAEQRVEKAREEFRRRTSGFTEPRAFRFPDGYTKQEHDAALDRILADIERVK